MKKSLARKIVRTGILAAGFLLLAGGTAQATDINSAGNYGLGNGNQIPVALQVPVAVCGNSIVAGGNGTAGCDGSVSAEMTADQLQNMNTMGNYGVLNGNQIGVQAQIPITACGNAVGILANSTAGCVGKSSAALGKKTMMTESARVTESAASEAAEASRAFDINSAGNYGLLNGNQAAITAQAPIAICGNAVGVAGNATAGCDGSVHAVAKPGLVPNMNTAGNYGALNGNQLGVGVQAPITACGNAIGVLANATAGCKGTSSAQAGSITHDDFVADTEVKPHASKSIGTAASKATDTAADAAGGLGGLDSLTSLLG